VAESGSVEGVASNAADTEEAFTAFNFCANWAVMDVGFSNSMPMSCEDQRQCEHSKINGPV
jgi:hypothetical protein